MNPQRYPLRYIYAITDRDLTPWSFEALYTLMRGVHWLQYRDKCSDLRTKRRQVYLLKQVCRRSKTKLVINDDMVLARRCQVPMLHLGKQEIRDGILAKIGQNVKFGCSCYDSVQYARQAKRRGARYAAAGSVYLSRTKPDAPRASLRTVRCLRQLSSQNFKTMAIGGIHFGNMAPVIRTGIDYVAMIRGFWLR